MAGSRTVKTLAALLVSMTVGALILMVLETRPIPSSPPRNLAAVAPPGDATVRAVRDTEVAVQQIKWQKIIVHAAAAATDRLARRCHFVVEQADPDGPASVHATDLWKRQLPGNHVYVPGYDFNQVSVGICLVGDFSRRSPSAALFNALLELTRALQNECGIGAEHVYLHSQLDPRSHSPGERFPAGRFSRALLRR